MKWLGKGPPNYRQQLLEAFLTKLTENTFFFLQAIMNSQNIMKELALENEKERLKVQHEANIKKLHVSIWEIVLQVLKTSIIVISIVVWPLKVE